MWIFICWINILRVRSHHLIDEYLTLILTNPRSLGANRYDWFARSWTIVARNTGTMTQKSVYGFLSLSDLCNFFHFGFKSQFSFVRSSSWRVSITTFSCDIQSVDQRNQHFNQVGWYFNAYWCRMIEFFKCKKTLTS